MKKPKTTVEYGRELEDYIAQKFIEIGYPYARRSKGSGNKNELGDISGIDSLACVEAKHYNKPNITIKDKTWKKLNSEIPLHSKRFPMYVLQNGENTRLVCLDVDDFFKILKEYVKNVEGK